MISNSSPIIFLAKIRQLENLRRLFGKITIPEAVKSELFVKESPEYNSIIKALDDKLIVIENPKKEIDLGSGKGENAAINLAKEKKEPLIIDDALGIKIAKSLNIDVFRTTSVILMMLKKKVLSKKEAFSLINKLVEEGYYISPKYYLSLIEKIK